MNDSESIAAAKYKIEGWKIANSGWPDFLLYRRNGGQIEIKFVEVKSAGSDLRPNQENVLRILSTLAPTVVCWSHDHFEKTIVPPLQDTYFHRTDDTPWVDCLQHETCNVKYHICEPGDAHGGC